MKTLAQVGPRRLAWPLLSATSASAAGPGVVWLLVPPDLAVEEVLGHLARSQPCSLGSARSVRQAWLDTFDWRLHRRGWSLLHEIGTEGDETSAHEPDVRAKLELRAHEGSGTPRPGQPVTVRLGSSDIPRGLGDLPPGRLRITIAPVVGIRCLIPLASALSVRRTVRILNSDEKTVVWVLAETSTLPDGRPLGARVGVIPVLGYPRAALAVSSWLEEDLGLEPGAEVFTAALAAGGRRPRDYSSKLDVALRPTDSFESAIGVLLTHLLTTLQANLAGARANLDPEFLHDIRVAVRRTRSLLGEAALHLGPVAEPGGPIYHLRDELAWLGEATGPTRDLDVWCLTLDEELRGGSPMAGALGALRQVIEVRRRAAHQELVETLDSPRLRELLAGWAGAASTQPRESDPGGLAAPVGLVAAQLVSRAHRRVLRRGRSIGPDSPDEALHDLRKAAKRLRYVLESFESLCPGRVRDRVISELKALQEVLGEFQDCAVQARFLAELGAQLGDSDPPAALIGIGYLVAGLESRSARARHDVTKRFARFERPTARAQVASLVSGLASGPRSRSATRGAGTA